MRPYRPGGQAACRADRPEGADHPSAAGGGLRLPKAAFCGLSNNEKNLLKYDVVVLDEMSMVDVKLFQSLLGALKHGCRVVMVGDADQLPSVGPGNILEVVRSGRCPRSA